MKQRRFGSLRFQKEEPLFLIEQKCKIRGGGGGGGGAGKKKRKKKSRTAHLMEIFELELERCERSASLSLEEGK